MNYSHGFVALTSILIIMAIVTLVAVGVSLRSVGEAKMGLAEESATKALSFANTCAEIATMKLSSILNYAGNESIVLEDATCSILSVAGSGNLSRTIKATSTISGFEKKVKVEVSQISPVFRVSSWEEVSDF